MTEQARQPFAFGRQGSIGIVALSADVEKMSLFDMSQAVQPILDELRADPVSGLVFDLTQVRWAGSWVIGILSRLHSRAAEQHLSASAQGLSPPFPDRVSDRAADKLPAVVAGATGLVRETLHTLCLDTVWRLCGTRAEALAALSSD